MSLLFLGAPDTVCLETVGKGGTVEAGLAGSERAGATVAWWRCRGTQVEVGDVSSLAPLYLRGQA